MTDAADQPKAPDFAVLRHCLRNYPPSFAPEPGLMVVGENEVILFGDVPYVRADLVLDDVNSDEDRTSFRIRVSDLIEACNRTQDPKRGPEPEEYPPGFEVALPEPLAAELQHPAHEGTLSTGERNAFVALTLVQTELLKAHIVFGNALAARRPKEAAMAASERAHFTDVMLDIVEAFGTGDFNRAIFVDPVGSLYREGRRRGVAGPPYPDSDSTSLPPEESPPPAEPAP